MCTLRIDVTIGDGPNQPHRRRVTEALDVLIPGYSVSDGEGRWEGEAEASFRVSLATMDDVQGAMFAAVAEQVAFECGEEAVLVEAWAPGYGAVLRYRDGTQERIG